VKDTSKGFIFKIEKKQIYGMIQHQMVQSGAGRHKKKFWEELSAYSPLIQNVPHRK
jgi:hypothetical protein